MTRRPFYRWKSFWLGILVLGFLGWAWVRSMRVCDVVTWGNSSGSWGWSLDHGSSQIWLGIERVYQSGPFPAGFDFQSLPHNDESLKSVFVPFTLKSGSGYTDLGVSHWFLILLFFIPWVSFLAWRVRRQRKLTETNA
jgi:hypothetical protein